MPSPLTGERIRTARKIYGISQEELEQSTGVSQALISYVERGAKQATPDVVAAIAASMELPIEFFDVVPEDIPLDSLRFRKQKTASTLTTARAQALFAEGFRVARRLTEDANYPVPDFPIATGEIGADDIVEIASATREALRIAADQPVPHLMRIVERAGIPIAPIVLPDAETEGPRSRNRHFGLSYLAGIGDRGFIGFFPGAQGDRDRFTIAHELGHIVLHTARNTADPEAEANLFAGELLLPRSRATEILTPTMNLRDYARLKATWGISIQALVLRANRIGAIDSDRMTSLYKQINARGWRQQEPVTVQPEAPALLGRLRRHLYGNQPLTDLRRTFALSTVLLRPLLEPQPSIVNSESAKVVSLADHSARR